MLKDAHVVGFAATSNAIRSREFYEKLLGLSLLSEDDFAIVFDANGTMLRIQKVDEVVPHQYTAIGWEVIDIKSELRELSGRGVAVERFPGMNQDENGIWISPAGARIAWFRDPDGNILSLTQFRS